MTIKIKAALPKEPKYNGVIERTYEAERHLVNNGSIFAVVQLSIYSIEEIFSDDDVSDLFRLKIERIELALDNGYRIDASTLLDELQEKRMPPTLFKEAKAEKDPEITVQHVDPETGEINEAETSMAHLEKVSETLKKTRRKPVKSSARKIP